MKRGSFVKMLAGSIAGVGASAKAIAQFNFADLVAGPIPRSVYVIDTKGELLGALNGRTPMANGIAIVSTNAVGNGLGAFERAYATLDEMRRFTAIINSH
jgi:hypothetical protein